MKCTGCLPIPGNVGGPGLPGGDPSGDGPPPRAFSGGPVHSADRSPKPSPPGFHNSGRGCAVRASFRNVPGKRAGRYDRQALEIRVRKEARKDRKKSLPGRKGLSSAGPRGNGTGPAGGHGACLPCFSGKTSGTTIVLYGGYANAGGAVAGAFRLVPAGMERVRKPAVPARSTGDRLPGLPEGAFIRGPRTALPPPAAADSGLPRCAFSVSAN